MARDAVIVDFVRTPFGRAGVRGLFKEITNVELMVPLFKAIVERNKLDPKQIDEIRMGSVMLNMPGTKARTYVFEAGLPDTVWGCDSDTQCASALETVVQACHCVMDGSADIVLAGGIETMDRVGPIAPEIALGQKGPGLWYGDLPSKAEYPPEWKQAELLPKWDAVKPGWIMNMLATAEAVHSRYGITREEADLVALASQQKAVAAQDSGILEREIIPITIKYKDGTSVTISKDQGPRRETNLEALAGLKPLLKPDGFVTAGNSCPRNDGGTIALVMSKDKAKELGLKPLATYRYSARVGVDPEVMGIGPTWSTKKMLDKTGMSMNDFGLIELNEAFSCVLNYFQRELKLSDEYMAQRMNVNGGAIALGHPLGATGARLAGTLAFEMKKRNVEWGLATLCQGGGMGYSVALQRENYDW